MISIENIVCSFAILIMLVFVPGVDGQNDHSLCPIQASSSTEHHDESSAEEHILYSSSKSQLRILRQKFVSDLCGKKSFSEFFNSGLSHAEKMFLSFNFFRLAGKSVVLRI